MASKTNEIQLFLKKTGGFVLLFLLAAFLLEIACNLIIKSNADFKLDSTSEYAVFGNSRPECAFNDSLIENFKNFSESGENYFYTRLKIEKLLSNNPEISTVFIEFGHSNIDKSYKEKLLSINDMSYRYPIFSPFLGMNDYEFFFSNGTEAQKNMIQAFPISLRKKMLSVVRTDFDYIPKMAGYKHLERNKIDSLITAFQNVEIEPLAEEDLFLESIEYLKEIVNFCNQHNKKVYLIRCPIHPDYPYYVNEKLLLNVLKNDFSGVPYLDFSKFPTTNAEFGDFTHLNHKGATRFSVWFDNLLKKRLLEQSNPQEFINSEMTIN